MPVVGTAAGVRGLLRIAQIGSLCRGARLEACIMAAEQKDEKTAAAVSFTPSERVNYALSQGISLSPTSKESFNVP